MTSPTPTTWATVADVLDVAGATVDEEQLRKANYALESIVGRTAVLDWSRTSLRDREWLRRAVAYQAAWMPDQPDEFGRMDVIQTGTSSSATTFTETAMVLAPHAKQALKRLSWIGDHTKHVKSGFTYPGDDGGPDDWSQYGLQWQAM